MLSVIHTIMIAHRELRAVQKRKKKGGEKAPDQAEGVVVILEQVRGQNLSRY